MRSDMALAIFFIIAALFTGVSIVTLGTFPAISVDEIGNCVIAQHFLKTKTTVYPLLEHVVHPSFSYLTGLADLGLRVPYFFLLSHLQKIIGIGYIPARAVSLVISWLIGLLLFVRIRRNMNTRTACIAVLFWICSLDAILVSHLVREDVFILLLYVLLPTLIMDSNFSNKSIGWFLAGLCGSIAFLGFHPNGLFVIGAGVFLYVLQVKTLTQPLRKGIFYLLGTAAGAIVSVAFVDIETYVLAKSAMTHSFYASRVSLWLERAWPWNLLADTILYFIRAKSFYVNEQLIHREMWQLASLWGFFAIVLSTTLVLIFEKSNATTRKTAWLCIFACFALGFGAGREEFIYRALVWVTAIPLMAHLLDSAWSELKPSRNKIILGAAFLSGCGFFFVFRSNLIFFICFSLFLLALYGVRDSALLKIAGGLMLTLLLLWIRDKAFLGTLAHASLAQFKSPTTLLVFFFSSIALGTSLYQTRKKTWWRPVLLASFLFWSLGLTAASAMVHMGRLGFMTRSLNATLADMERLVGPFQGRLLGPNYLWFWKKDQVHDIGGILMDFYYAGYKRPRECIDRVRPEYLVIDDEFKRRYLSQPVPLAFLISAPFHYVGTVEASLHHSALDVFKIDWPTHQTN